MVPEQRVSPLQNRHTTKLVIQRKRKGKKRGQLKLRNKMVRCLSALKLNKKVLHIIWSMICLTGLIIQIVSICNQYFAYPITSKVFIGYQTTFTPPALSICIDMKRMVDVEKAARHGYCGKFQSSVVCYESLDNSSPAAVYYNYTHDLVHRVYRKIAKAKKFYYGTRGSDYKCIRVVYETPYGDSLTLYDLKINQIFQVKLFPQKIVSRDQNLTANPLEIQYHVHSNDIFPHKLMTVSGNTSHSTFITYSEYTTIRVSTPVAPCVDYRRTRWESKGHCVEECSIYESYLQCMNRGIHYNMSQLEEENYKRQRINLCRSQKFERVLTSFENINLFPCNKSHCPKECKVRFYQPFIKGHKITLGTMTTIRFLHVNPTTTIIFDLDIELLEFIIYIASLTGLWFGFVIFDSVKTIIRLMNVYYVSHHQTKIHNSNVAVNYHTGNQIVSVNQALPPID